MRIAVISDIHANIQALEAVWEDLESQSPDLVYCLGDLVGYGAHPNQVVEFIRERQIPTLMGNHDAAVGYDQDDCGCVYNDAELGRLGDISLEWSRAHTSQPNKAYLQTLPMQIRSANEKLDLLLVHGSPRRINEYLFEDRPAATFERINKAARCELLLFGHTHLSYQKRVNGTLFVNAGSVGRPKDGDPRAGYVLIEAGRRVKVEFRRIAYDVESAAQAIRDSDLPNYYADELLAGGSPEKARDEDSS